MAHSGVMTGELAAGGRWVVRLAATAADVTRAQALRYRAFRDADGTGLDADCFDARARHLLVEDRASGALAACLRVLRYDDGTGLEASYAGQFYDLSGMAGRAGPLLELGRFCVAPGLRDPDVLRLAWGAIAGLVEREGVRFLFGCTSFQGTDPAAFREAFGLLAARHLAPEAGAPRRKAPEVHRLAGTGVDLGAAMAELPPLLRSYLALGGWVSDHAVIDRDLGTIHVFTGLDVSAVSQARARVLRALADRGPEF